MSTKESSYKFLTCAGVTTMRTTRSVYCTTRNTKNLLLDDSAVCTTMSTKNYLNDYKNVLLNTVRLIICAVVTAMSTKNSLNDECSLSSMQ